MTKKSFKRAYIEKGWWNPLTNKYESNEFAVHITKVTIVDEFDSEDEDEIKAFGGFKTVEEANEFIKTEFKVKEVINEVI